MFTSTNRFIDDHDLDFLSNNAYTGGLDLLHHWKDKEFYIDAKLMGSYIDGSTEAITALQESSARYYQRPGADYLNYDTTATSLSGYGGKLKIGKGSKGLWRYSTSAAWLSPGLELNDLGYMQKVDEIEQENELSYFVNQSVSIFRTYEIGLEQFNTWNFNGTYLGSGGHLSVYSEFKNQWSFSAFFIYHAKSIDTKLLRGGNNMKIPSRIETNGSLKTDPSKKLIASFGYEYERIGQNSGSRYVLEPGLTLRPTNSLRIRISVNYEDNHNDLQYVTTKGYLNEKRYILATIDQQTLGFTFRVDFNLTPEFSIQYYGSPFVSQGSYSEFKHITDPLNKDYNNRFALYQNPVLNEGVYQLDENNDATFDYTISDPDFIFYQFRSNLVAKWEYRLGSYIHFVWSSDRTRRISSSNKSIGKSYRQLWDIFPGNVFLVKFNYWFSL